MGGRGEVVPSAILLHLFVGMAVARLFIVLCHVWVPAMSGSFRGEHIVRGGGSSRVDRASI